MRHGLAVGDDVRNDVFAEITGRRGVGRIAAQQIEQKRGFEHVDAHAGERPLRMTGDTRWIGRLLEKVHDTVVGIHLHHAEFGRVLARHFEHADRDVGILIDVLLEHELVIHLVDMVAGQDHHVLGVIALDDVHVLIHGIGGAVVPLRLAHALTGRQNIEAFVALGAQKVPAALQVANQAMRFVLRGNADATNAGVEGVGEREVDNARLATKIHGRLGPSIGQFVQSGSATAGEHVRHGVSGDKAGAGGSGHVGGAQFRDKESISLHSVPRADLAEGCPGTIRDCMFR